MIEYLSLREFQELRDEVYDFLPCCSINDAIPDQLSIHEIVGQDMTYRINPKSVMFPEMLEEEYGITKA